MAEFFSALGALLLNLGIVALVAKEVRATS